MSGKVNCYAESYFQDEFIEFYAKHIMFDRRHLKIFSMLKFPSSLLFKLYKINVFSVQSCKLMS